MSILSFLLHEGLDWGMSGIHYSLKFIHLFKILGYSFK